MYHVVKTRSFYLNWS